MGDVPLSDERLDRLISLIQDSFRVGPNEDPIYVELANNLERVRSDQHQVVLGRRGSGKSCLLVHFHRSIAQADNTLSIYIDCYEIKRLGYPDALIRLLLTVTDQIPGKRRNWFTRRLPFLDPTPLDAQTNELRSLLDLAEQSDVVEEHRDEEQRRAEAGLSKGPASATAGRTTGSTHGLTTSFKARKLDTLERHFSDYKRTIETAFAASKFTSGAVIVDDFYLIDRSIQADVLDYLHRLLRGTSLYLKLGTVRHRTTMHRSNGQSIGVEPGEDIEEINLDRTFDDVASTQEFLELMLDEMAGKIGIESASDFISPEGLLHLTLASGGVPRDYLNTLVEAIPAARSANQKRVSPTSVYKGAGRLSYRNKLSNLREEAGDDATAIERVFSDLATFCLQEQKTTGFLISQEEVGDYSAEHEIIQQLMDFKLIHVVEPDTSAASNREGRYEAYTLDFASLWSLGSATCVIWSSGKSMSGVDAKGCARLRIIPSPGPDEPRPARLRAMALSR